MLARVTVDLPARIQHFIYGRSNPIQAAEFGAPVPSAGCKSCHGSSLGVIGRDVTRGLRISHKEPLAAGAECVDCHRLFEGQVLARTVGMEPCLRCHDGTQAKATCSVCHEGDPAKAIVAVTPANLSIYGTALDDKGDLFVAQVNGPILSAPGPVPATGFYATPAALPNSPTGVYSLAVDNYCNVIAGGANGTIYVLGTTGQPGGGYGQVTPVVNSTLAPAGGVGGTTLDAKGDVFFVVGSQIYELAPPYSKKPTALINIPGAGITSMAIDTSGNLITADYSNNKIEEIAPPYTSYTTIISGVLSNAAAVVIGP